MKVCTHCGTVQSDDRTVCIECQAVLTEKMPEDMEKKYLKKQRKTLKRLSDKSEDLHVTPLDAAIGIASLLMSLAAIIMSATGYSENALLIFVAVAGIPTAAAALLPKLLFSIEKIFLSLKLDEKDLTPSGYYLTMRRFVIYAAFTTTLILFLMSVLAPVG